MAEIHVQTKKQSSSLTWVWILIVFLVIAAVAYYFVSRNKTNEVKVTDTDASSFIDLKRLPHFLLGGYQGTSSATIFKMTF